MWKDLGLHVRDGAGELVLPDDERLAGVWQTAGELGIPIWWHIADPLAFFDPVDEHNEFLELLAARPDWSFAGPEFPTFERLMDALEAVVAANPRTRFVAVHAGCNAEDLGWVGRMLDTYPNLHIDIAARLSQLGRQPRATRELVLRHPDRVLFGCDEIPHTGASYPTALPLPGDRGRALPSLGRRPADDGPLGHQRHRPARTTSCSAVYADNAARLVPRLAAAAGHTPPTSK